MKADYLVIPIDSQTINAMDTALQSSKHQPIKKISNLAHLLNTRTLARLDQSNLASLRKGLLLHHQLGLFRQRLQRIVNAHMTNTHHQIIVDPLLAIMAPIWISTVRPKLIIIAHSGIDRIADDIRSIYGESESFSQACARRLITEVIANLPVDSSYHLVEIDGDQCHRLLNPANFEEFKRPDDQIFNNDHPSSPEPENGMRPWLAWDLMTSNGQLALSADKLELSDRYRLLELEFLKIQNKKQSKKEISKIIDSTKKCFGEYHEPRVRSIGRRLRYALQMLFCGRVYWKSNRSKKSKLPAS